MLALDIKGQIYFTERNMSNEPGKDGLFAYNTDIMSWLFGKEAIIKNIARWNQNQILLLIKR